MPSTARRQFWGGAYYIRRQHIWSMLNMCTISGESKIEVCFSCVFFSGFEWTIFLLSAFTTVLKKSNFSFEEMLFFKSIPCCRWISLNWRWRKSPTSPPRPRPPVSVLRRRPGTSAPAAAWTSRTDTYWRRDTAPPFPFWHSNHVWI